MNSVEIAKIAGVSRSTVSKVINNYPDVKAKTRERVLKIIKEYDYIPDFSASVLAGKRTNTIGFFMNIDGNLPKERLVYNNDFYSLFLNSVIDRANASDYFVTACRISGEDTQNTIKTVFSEKRIDSAIIVGADDKIIENVAQLSCPVVFSSYDKRVLEENTASALRNQMSFVTFNAYDAFKKITEKLVLGGYRNFGLFHSGISRNTFADRYRAFYDVMGEYGLSVNPDFVINCNLSPAVAASEIDKLILKKQLPEVIICINDVIAITIMERLSRCGYSIPDDVAVTGFDDIPHAKYTLPPLTTVRIPVHEMATKATERAIEMINNPDYKCTEDIFETKMICRESAKI